MKQTIYENKIERRIGVDYSTVMQFKTSLINMEEATELIIINQPEKKQQKRCQCVSIEHLQVLLQGFSLWDLQLEGPENW